ncbi:hypothetical protein ACFWCA_48875 [Streptomyces phaeochromogenes]|uniref:hypothetical protein n=1 Tax=Streptomyces phaeochromogenes TaxID=1923 RepID=UPI003697A966
MSTSAPTSPFLFVMGSAGYGPAPRPGALVAALPVQEVGAAMVVPSSLALLRETFPDPAARARAIALWSVSGSVDERRGHSAAGSSPSKDSGHRHRRGPRLLER